MKYKEMRMLVILILLIIVMLSGTVYFLVIKDLARTLIASLLSFITIMMLFTKYTMKVFNDSLLGYEFKGIGILPELIEFKDIKEYTLISKHSIDIEHGHKTRLHIVNASAFYQELDTSMKAYKNSGK